MNTPLAGAGRRQYALTLVELVSTLTVGSILLAIGVPSVLTLTASSSLTTAANNMTLHLHLARSEAVKRGVPVILCPSTDGLNCQDSFEWQQGFILFADENRNRMPDESDPILRFQQPNRHRVSILTSVGRKRLTYRPDGRSPGSTATITLCDLSATIDPKAIILSNSGRPRLSTTRPDGGPLNCD